MPRVRAGAPLPRPQLTMTMVMQPSASQVRQDVATLKGLLDDWTPPLRYSKQLLIKETKRSFYEHVDTREGDKEWKEWSANYRRGKQPLQRSGKLFSIIKNPNTWRTWRKGSQGGVDINIQRLPWYWEIHQFGYPPEAAGGWESMSPAQRKQLATNVFVRLRKSGFFKGSRLTVKEQGERAIELAKIEATMDAVIPKRGFIAGGANTPVAAQIEKVLGQWAADSIQIYRWRKSGVGSSHLILREI